RGAAQTQERIRLVSCRPGVPAQIQCELLPEGMKHQSPSPVISNHGIIEDLFDCRAEWGGESRLIVLRESEPAVSQLAANPTVYPHRPRTVADDGFWSRLRQQIDQMLYPCCPVSLGDGLLALQSLQSLLFVR